MNPRKQPIFQIKKDALNPPITDGIYRPEK